MNLLSCTVRGCGQPLARQPHQYVCPSSHTFDIARTGYVNLLQPQDRRSPRAGDSRDAAEARVRLHEAGVGRRCVEQVVSRAALVVPGDGLIVDLGCGVGDALAMVLASRPEARGVGIDISTPAIERAARRHPDPTWVVANADRRIPVLDASAALVISLNGRRNPDETARILAPGGRLLVVAPAPDDLIELRARIQGEAIERSRADALLAEHTARFELTDRTVVSEQTALDPPQLEDLLRITYRGLRTSEAARVRELTQTRVTMAWEMFVFTVRAGAASRAPAYVR